MKAINTVLISVAICLVVGMVGAASATLITGTTNFGSLALDNDLTVADDVSIGGDLAMTGSISIPDDIALNFGAVPDVVCMWDETTTDRLLCTFASATSGWNIVTGNLFVGNGTPGQTINGEDAYIEGLVEIDGVLYTDGGIKIPDNINLTIGTSSDFTLAYDETTSDDLILTSAAAASLFNVLVGSVAIGNGTPTVAQDGEDLYVESVLEVDGASYLDGGALLPDGINLTLGTGADVTLAYDEAGVDRAILTSAAAGGLDILVGNLFIGNGAPTVALDGEDLYVEGTSEFDGAMNVGGVLTLAGGGNVPDGINLYFGTDSDSSFYYDETTTDRTIFNAAAASGLNVVTGNLFIGNGTPGVALDGEDLYVEGTSEFDGAATFAGATFAGAINANAGGIVADDQSLAFGTGSDWTLAYDETTSDDLLITGAAASLFNILTGNLNVGNGTPTNAQDGEDAYVEGTFENDGGVGMDGGGYVADDQELCFGTGLDWKFKYDETTSDDLLVTGAAGSLFNILTGNLNVGNGTPTIAQDGEDFYVEGTAEFDSTIYPNAGQFISVAAAIRFSTATKAHKTTVAPIGYVSATNYETGGAFSPITSVGIEAGGQAIVGTADAFISFTDAADYLYIGFSVPELTTLGAAADLILSFDMIEDTDEECNIDVRIFEYGNATPIVTDTILMANGAARAWKTLVTLATGIGALVSPGEFLIIEITPTADTDQYKIYGAKATYAVGIENDAT